MGLDGLGKFSSEDHDFESLEVSEVLSKFLFLDSLSFSTLEEEIRSLLELGYKGFDVRVFGEVFKDVLSGLNSFDRDNLSLDSSIRSVNNDLLGVYEVSDNGKFLRVRTIVEIYNSSNLNEYLRIH